jgi:hypothetical protein
MYHGVYGRHDVAMYVQHHVLVQYNAVLSHVSMTNVVKAIQLTSHWLT